MIEFIKDLFNGSRFVNSKYLDNQFDCFVDYVDITEDDLEEKIFDLSGRIDDLEETLDSVIAKSTELMKALNAELASVAKKPKKVSKTKVSKKKATKK